MAQRRKLQRICENKVFSMSGECSGFVLNERYVGGGGGAGGSENVMEYC